MGDHLDTGTLLARETCADKGSRRSILFIVHRAADGWLAVDLIGEEIARFGREASSGRRSVDRAELRCLRGGVTHPDRMFSLYALDLDPETCGGLRVPAAGPVRFGFGGDLELVVREACTKANPRLLLFRGVTALPGRSRSLPARAIAARASPELVFETLPARLWEAVRRLAGVPRLARAPPGTTGTAFEPSRRVSVPYSARKLNGHGV